MQHAQPARPRIAQLRAVAQALLENFRISAYFGKRFDRAPLRRARACGFAATPIKKKQELLFLRGASDYNGALPRNTFTTIANPARAMHIGPYQLKNNLIVAPMAGVTDRPFRQLCKTMGAGMAVSEMVASNRCCGARRRRAAAPTTTARSTRSRCRSPAPIPRMMAEAARYNVDQGAQIIDINMGCPAKKVCNVMAGSALLKDEPLVGRILEAVVAAVDVPVTLKIRTGWDRDNRNALRSRADRRGGRHPGARDPRPHARLRLLRRGRVRHHRRGEGRGRHPGDRQRRHRHARAGEAGARLHRRRRA